MSSRADGKSGEAKEKVLFAVDIEGSGASVSKNGIVAIGWCVGDLKGNVLEKRRVSVKLQNRLFEPRCVNQYWTKPEQAAQLQVFLREAVDPYEAIRLFMSAVDSFEDKYDVTILSDNPAYDIAWLNSYIDTFLGRNPLLYQKDQTTYRGVAEPKAWAMSRKMRAQPSGSWSFNMDKYNAGLEDLKRTAPHDHWPENDAEAILRKTLLLLAC